MIYAMGKETGARDVQTLREELKALEAPANKRVLLDKSLQRASNMGWGKLILTEYDPLTGIVNIKVKHNPFSDACGSKDAGGCFFLQGYAAGVVEEVTEEPVEYGSPRCLDAEKNTCLFRMIKPMKWAQEETLQPFLQPTK